jgi:hypothetical protein
MQTLKERKPKADVPSSLLPMLVRFRDVADPSTVEVVDPRDLERAFGTGVRLRVATIEITDERITRGIRERLPWIAAVRARRSTLDGDTPPTLEDIQRGVVQPSNAGARSYHRVAGKHCSFEFFEPTNVQWRRLNLGGRNWWMSARYKRRLSTKPGCLLARVQRATTTV